MRGDEDDQRGGSDARWRRTARRLHLVTIVPANTASDYYEGWTYENSAFRLDFVEPWAMDTIVLCAARIAAMPTLFSSSPTTPRTSPAGCDTPRTEALRRFHPGDGAVAP